MALLMLKPGHPSGTFRRAVGHEKKRKVLTFTVGEPTKVTNAERQELIDRGEHGTILFDCEIDDKGRMRAVENIDQSDNMEMASSANDAFI